MKFCDSTFASAITQRLPLGDPLESAAWKLICVEEASSTMDMAKLIAEEGIQLPRGASTVIELPGRALKSASSRVVVLARAQSAGRGRQGRNWVSRRDHGLYLTFLFCPDLEVGELSGLSLVVGIAIVRALKGLSVDVTLKWPNDIVVEEPDGALAKLGGVLIEHSQLNHRSMVSIGIGLNIMEDLEVSGIGGISLAQIIRRAGRELSADISLGAVFSAIAWQVTSICSNFVRQGFRAFRKEWLDKSILDQKRVRVTVGREEFEGVVCGINEQGGLLLTDGSADGAVRTVYSGEVSIGYVTRS